MARIWTDGQYAPKLSEKGYILVVGEVFSLLLLLLRLEFWLGWHSCMGGVKLEDKAECGTRCTTQNIWKAEARLDTRKRENHGSLCLGRWTIATGAGLGWKRVSLYNKQSKS